MKLDILTLFPKMFEGVLGESMLKIARKKKKLNVRVHNLRDWASDKHKTADDKPYGGGSGMILKIEPLYKALARLSGKKKNVKIVLLTPRGKTFNQKTARKLAGAKHIVLICGHYEGVDERIRSLVTDEISIGDYIMTGGEIPAMAVLDAVARLIPGVLGGAVSAKHESFEKGLLEYPHYTRPREFKGMRVPEVLLSGNHKAIDAWRKKESLKRTKEVRSDLLWKK
jgi:tRNA (guanine37-N1)-methyltransferase